MNSMKTCTDCGQSKPDSEYYSKPSYKCRECKRIRGRARYAPIKAAVKDKRLATYRGDKKRCRVCGKYKTTDNYPPHKDHWDRLAHDCRECRRKESKVYYQNNSQRMKEKNRRNYLLNKDKTATRGAKWRKDNPDKSHAIWHRYRSRKVSAGGDFTAEQWNTLVKFYCPKRLCLCCQKRRKLHKDHVVPLSKGGSNSIANIQPICHNCNSTKNTKDIDYRPDAGKFARSLL